MSERTTPATSWLPRPFAAPADVPPLPWPATTAARDLTPPIPGEAPRRWDATVGWPGVTIPAALGGDRRAPHPFTLARRRLGLTLREVADELGVAEGTIRYWLGYGLPRRRVPAVARVFGTDEATARSWFEPA